MADVLSYILLALGIVLMVTGYRRNSRNMLVWAGLLLCAGAGVSDFVHGFTDGIHAAQAVRA